jgi:mono/diheme cytochrome c family protein
MFTSLSEQELSAVVEYVKFFSRRWRKPDNFAPPIPFPDPPKWLSDAGERKPHAESGRKLFAAACAACHGFAGDGKPPAGNQLKDLWGFDVTPADLRQPHLRSGDQFEDIFRVLTTGLDGTPMASFAEVFTPEQRWDIAAYIGKLREQPAPAK